MVVYSTFTARIIYNTFQVFDAYAQFEESMINTKMEGAGDEDVDEEGNLQELHLAVTILCKMEKMPNKMN